MPTAPPLPFETPAFDIALQGGGNPIKLFREALKTANEQLADDFNHGASASLLVHRRAHIIDRLLKKLWARHITTEGVTVALVAVGGYGRGELHPGSDVDIQLLMGENQADQLRDAVSSFLAFLWDTGLEVGHSVRTVAQCAEEAEKDITVATNLMEARLLSGNAELLEAMRAAVSPEAIWPSRNFFQAKLLEQVARHRKYHDTAYNLEPNIKEGPGGLRDIQVIGWVAKRHFGAGTLADLVSHGFLTDAEYRALSEGQSFLWQVRFALHVLTGRREDRLLFDYQRTLATQLGFSDGGPNLAVEQFMRQYYRTVKELSRLNELLLQLFQEAILYADEPKVGVSQPQVAAKQSKVGVSQSTPINKRFQSRKGFIEVTSNNVFKRYPFALLEIFLLLQQHPELIGVRASTMRLLRDHLHLVNEQFRKDLRNRSLFMEILRQARGVTSTLRRMNRYGMLGAYLPAFDNIVGLMQYDLFHVYTVDEHTLMVIRNVRRFSRPQFNQEFPLCSEIMQSRIPKQEVLYLAALFHDIAKGRGGDHSELGAEEATAFCLHHGMSQYDARLIAWLVKNHLLMSMTSQRKDISDPDVLTEFATLVGSAAYLNYLYLLTVADIRGTNPSLWNSWKDSLLLELFRGSMRVFLRGLDNPIDQAELISATQAEARSLLTTWGCNGADIERIWAQFTEDYFLRYSPDEVAWHTQAILNHTEMDTPLIIARHQTERGGTELFIHTRIDDRLFARTTHALGQLGLNIVDARVLGSHDGYALDTYIVLEENGEPISDPQRIQDIFARLSERLSHLERDGNAITRRPPRQFKHFAIPTTVHFSHDERKQRTVLELSTADRPGLLSQLGRALLESGVRLQNAKITTFGARVEDVFFITDQDNQPLRDEAALARLRESIHRSLDRNAAAP